MKKKKKLYKLLERDLKEVKSGTILSWGHTNHKSDWTDRTLHIHYTLDKSPLNLRGQQGDAQKLQRINRICNTHTVVGSLTCIMEIKKLLDEK